MSMYNDIPTMGREAILEEAKRCVCQDRDFQYGDPEDNFQLTANLWQDYVYSVTGKAIVIEPKDVAVMMILLKVARIATGKHTTDNWTDIAGYAACGGEIQGRRQV